MDVTAESDMEVPSPRPDPCTGRFFKTSVLEDTDGMMLSYIEDMRILTFIWFGITVAANNVFFFF